MQHLMMDRQMPAATLSLPNDEYRWHPHRHRAPDGHQPWLRRSRRDGRKALRNAMRVATALLVRPQLGARRTRHQAHRRPLHTASTEVGTGGD